ncbi:5'-methylthioadenosine/S-adenosylhomocysteine nucleosidase isoform X7 [Glycine max]|uniref:5'-methylthioadenosine/S-adenosylhomocysteine nucleosidase isoform X7 n=1 Tax=Glycine max TaxID=3847 RepID=UPI0007190DF5|nr:5'-methylthioadenosine/S-adenosylhomocysteine nucleosidase isoform X7 [Glycine max]|eukprot:XP_014632667.1 5'-methylthioadenosine/S-adenosylhomocysteine nucleosidase 2 isoform X5 [Glycine max]
MAAQPKPQNRPISNIVFVVAMQTEALPIVNRFQLTEDPHSPSVSLTLFSLGLRSLTLISVEGKWTFAFHVFTLIEVSIYAQWCRFPQGAPWVHYHGTFKDLNINLIWTGNDPTLGVDSIGTIPSALATYAAILALQPDLIINAGTAGGFKAKGASIGDIFVVSECAFHDRRIPIPIFDLYGVGLRKAFETPKLVKELNLKGAAIAYVADLLKVPAIFIKAVTNNVDDDKAIVEEFLQNLAALTVELGLAVEQVINFINGKCISEL